MRFYYSSFLSQFKCIQHDASFGMSFFTVAWMDCNERTRDGGPSEPQSFAKPLQERNDSDQRSQLETPGIGHMRGLIDTSQFAFSPNDTEDDHFRSRFYFECKDENWTFSSRSEGPDGCV